jgi:hypothetical protein
LERVSEDVREVRHCMRAATLSIVLAIHALFFLLFALSRGPAPWLGGADAPATTLIFLPEDVKPVESVHAPPVAARAARRAAPVTPAPLSPAPEPAPDPSSITPTPTPDWRAQVSIAANTVLEAERRKREHPSVLEPHDFSGVTPGSTDTSKPGFGWYHARTHRVEGSPGALVVNINDRCAIAVLLIFPFPLCKVGKMAASGNLFEHMYDLPDPKVPNLP